MLDNLSLDNYNNYSIAPPIKQPSRNIVQPPKEIQMVYKKIFQTESKRIRRKNSSNSPYQN